MEQSKQKDLKTTVVYLTQTDGSMDVTAIGSNGTLTLRISANGPTMSLAGSKGAWSLLANGHLKGWLRNNEGQITWFPEPAKQKPTRRRAKTPKTKEEVSAIRR